MAANVTERDGVFTVRGAAWWDLDGSHDLSEYPTREQVEEVAFNWQVIQEPVYLMHPTITTHTHTADCLIGECDLRDDLGVEHEQIEGFRANVRDDNGEVLGIVTDTYEPVQNTVMLDIAEAIEAAAGGEVRYETGGTLKGGRKAWLLMRPHEPITINGDPNGKVIPYVAFQNAHDGSGALRLQATATRIVCDNTAQMADFDSRARGTEYVFSHTKNVADRIEEAKAALAAWRGAVDSFQLMMEHLVTEKVTGDQVERFIVRFIKAPAAGTVTDRVMQNVEDSRDLFKGILAGPTLEGVAATKYGLVQASVEYLNHGRRAHTAETRFKRNYLDREKIVVDAMKLVGAL